MAYIQKIIAKEETLHGIARLHWIYIVHGVLWFLVLAGSGWLLNSLIMQGLMMTASATNSMAFPTLFMGATNWLTFFFMAGGFLLFMLYVVKVLFTEIGLTDRRVINKTGMIFVKVHQVDLEEIRGEDIDLGWFGRFFSYGYIKLDCRFIGDVRLAAIENPERFIRGLHALRAGTQDSLSVIVGKGNPKHLVLETPDDNNGAQNADMQAQQNPDIEPGKPAGPETNPGEQPARPEIKPEPTPHAPPPSAPPQQPERPAPQPTQPIPAPPPSEPPLQPPGDQTGMSADDVAKLLKEALPEMAHLVIAELAQKGLLKDIQGLKDHPDIDNDLIHVFDDASQNESGEPDELHDKMGHAIH